MIADDVLIAWQDDKGEWCELPSREVHELIVGCERQLADETALWTSAEREFLERSHAFLCAIELGVELQLLEEAK
jgi:hypothetical protein